MRTSPMIRNTAPLNPDAPDPILDIGVTEEQMRAAERTEIGGGLVQYSVRCGVPFRIPLTAIRRRAPTPPAPPAVDLSEVDRAVEEARVSMEAEQQRTGFSPEVVEQLKAVLDRRIAEREALKSAAAARADHEDDDENSDDDDDKGRTISGVASSTSVDSFGTEMSRGALDDMAEQFRAGVAYLPRHGSWFVPVEWDEQIGLTIDAEVFTATVANAHPDAEEQAMLRVFTDLWPGATADLLLQRISDEQAPGQSIGGWFRRVVWIWNEDTDELERIIVEEVELDHLAATRRPANPDSEGMERLRSMIHSLRSAPPPPAATTEDTTEPGEDVHDTEPTSLDPDGIRSTGVQDEVAESPLDTRSSTSHSIPDPAQQDRAENTSSSGESEMTPEELEAILLRHISPITVRLTALEGRALEPTVEVIVDPPAVVDDADVRARVAELEAQNEALNGRMAHLLQQPQRRGIIGVGMLPEGGEEAQTEMRAVLDLALEGAGQGGMAATRSFFSEQGAGMRAFERGVDPLEPMSRDQSEPILSQRGLKNLLRSGLRAFALDGMLGSDALTASWGS